MAGAGEMASSWWPCADEFAGGATWGCSSDGGGGGSADCVDCGAAAVAWAGGRGEADGECGLTLENAPPPDGDPTSALPGDCPPNREYDEAVGDSVRMDAGDASVVRKVDVIMGFSFTAECGGANDADAGAFLASAAPARIRDSAVW